MKVKLGSRKIKAGIPPLNVAKMVALMDKIVERATPGADVKKSKRGKNLLFDVTTKAGNHYGLFMVKQGVSPWINQMLFYQKEQNIGKMQGIELGEAQQSDPVRMWEFIKKQVG